jgi:HEXXH motif-containing protein
VAKTDGRPSRDTAGAKTNTRAAVDFMYCLPDETFARAQARFERLLLGIYAFLPDTLRKCGLAGHSLATKFECWFQPLSGLIAEDFVRVGTPFFWFNLTECWAAAIDQSPQVDVSVQRTLLTAFDAFFEYLPDGLALNLRADVQSDILLPRIGVRIPATLRPITLIRRSPGLLRVATSAGIREISPFQGQTTFPPSTARISKYPSLRVLLAQTPALSGEDGDAAASLDVPLFVEMLGQSLRLIDAADPQLAAAITRAINWYVPVTTTDLSVHRSYTRPNLMGVIYLSLALNSVILAEAVVHEFYHSVLHLVMAAENVLDLGLDEKFYSPWRDDPRPLEGLFHAIYVSSGVARFYVAAESVLESGDLWELAQWKRAKLHHQLCTAVSQVPREHLSNTGISILEGICADLSSDREVVPALEMGSQKALKQHWEIWRRQNPQLAERIQTEQFIGPP